MTSSLFRSAAFVLPLMVATASFAQTTSGAAPAAMPMGAAPSPTTAMTGPSGKLSKMDKNFVTKAAQGGAAEVAMAQLAQQKSQSDSVKQFAQGMIDDHTPANQKLASLASADGMTAPTEPDAAQQKMMTHLQSLSGAKFDHAYINGQVKAHETMLKLFQRESTGGQNADLKSFADSTVPVIQKHITMAEAVK